MMCYRDTTFCGFSKCVKFDKCKSALTEEVLQNAGKLNLAVAEWTSEPDCYEEV